MSDTLQSTPATHLDLAAHLMAEVGLAPATLGAALFELAAQWGAGLSIKDPITGRYQHVNEVMAAIFGRPMEDIVGRVDADLIDAAVWVPLRAADQFAATQSTAQTHVHRVELVGTVREFSVTRICLRATDKATPSPMLSIWVDQSAQRQRDQLLQQALRQLEMRAADEAEHAVLTSPGEQNEAQLRVHFDDQLRRELDLSSREHREFALVSVAIDPLGDALLRHGELARERVQQAVSRLLRRNTRAMDASCRLDDTRFAILLSGVGLATAHSRIEGLRRQCATEIIPIDGQDLHFTVAMGVASYPHTAQDRDCLSAAAETALGQAQRRGGNHVALATIRFEQR